MKRIAVILLACSLLLMAAAPVRAENVTVNVSSTGGSAPYSADFDASWFLQSAQEYHHGLARISLGLAVSAFRAGRADPAANIHAFFRALSFRDPDVRQFEVTLEDSIGTAMAWRYLDEARQTPLVVIGVSGGNYGDEWASNFDLGDGEMHRGFYQSAQIVAQRAREYVAAIAELKDAPVRFWISGYSRGAAVGNIAAALLAEEELAPDDRVFAYTFATPRTLRGGSVGAHPNIFSIVNVADLVPQVPMADWGYGRFGRTLYLPSSLDQQGDYAALLPAYADAYAALTGRSDAAGDFAFAGMARAAAHGMAMTVRAPERYTVSYRTMLTKALTGQALTNAENILAATLLINMANSAFAESGQQISVSIMDGMEKVMEAVSGLSVILYQHSPEIYAAWMLALPDGEALLNNSLTLTDAPGA